MYTNDGEELENPTVVNKGEIVTISSYPEADYKLDGVYEGSTKRSVSTNYKFNTTSREGSVKLTAKFIPE